MYPIAKLSNLDMCDYWLALSPAHANETKLCPSLANQIDPVNLNESFSLDAFRPVIAAAYQKQLKIAVTIPR